MVFCGTESVPHHDSCSTWLGYRYAKSLRQAVARSALVPELLPYRRIACFRAIVGSLA